MSEVIMPFWVLVNVSAASMRQPFHPCDPDFIRDVCHASCCRSTTDPSGIAVTVTDEDEAVRIESLGATVDRTTLRISPVARRCPFQSADGLCGIHDQQPFGCVASPFTFTPRRTLIVRNRYRSLKCFKAPGAVPVYKAHRRSLVAIFGEAQTVYLTRHLDDGGDDVHLPAPRTVVDALLAKSARSKVAPQ